MRHVISTSILFLFALVANAQIYTKVTKYDKFDDVEWTKQVKTLITKTEVGFDIETKGQEPVSYYCFLLDSIGNRNNVENLVADVYGFQLTYLVLTKDELYQIFEEISKETGESNISGNNIDGIVEEKLKSRMNELSTLTHRTISKLKYSYIYDTEMVWIRYGDGSRIIYSK